MSIQDDGVPDFLDRIPNANENLGHPRLRMFCRYIRAGRYPEWQLLERFADAFEQILDEEADKSDKNTDFRGALELQRPKQHERSSREEDRQIAAVIEYIELTENEGVGKTEARKRVGERYHKSPDRIRDWCKMHESVARERLCIIDQETLPDRVAERMRKEQLQIERMQKQQLELERTVKSIERQFQKAHNRLLGHKRRGDT